MTRQPRLTIVLPWRFTGAVKRVQASSRKASQVKLGGDREGLRVTATPTEFLRMGLGCESDSISAPMVGQLREVRVPVTASRTVYLPGKVSIVEIKASVPSKVAERIADALSKKSPSDVLTVYDDVGEGHTRVRSDVQVEVPTPPDPDSGPEDRVEKRAHKLRTAGSPKYQNLVKAIQDIWEKDGDDLSQMVDWDDSDYEQPVIQDILSGVLDQYLTTDQLEEWESLEPEMQTTILNRAFPQDAVRGTMQRLEKHFMHQTRGASIQERPRTLQACADPLDLGVGEEESLVKMSRGGTVHDLFFG